MFYNTFSQYTCNTFEETYKITLAHHLTIKTLHLPLYREERARLGYRY